MMKQSVDRIVKETIEKHNLIENGDTIVLGLSGGPDSMCLFDVLVKLSKDMDLKIQPVHVNHKMRPGAAERDQEFVESVCRKHGLECRTYIVDCLSMAQSQGMTGEEAGRKARYDAFYETAKSLTGNVKIAVAQNANDQAETVLFRLLRGTGTDGLAGVAYERYEVRAGGSFKVIRPLLDVFRSDIEDYCQKQKLDPVRDHTNDEAIYSRNKLRLELLPLLEREYNENIFDGLVRLSKIAAADKDYIWQQVEAEYQRVLISETKDQIIFDRQNLAELHDAIRHRIALKAFGQIGLTSDVSAERLAAADKIIGVKQGPKVVEFPRHYFIKVAKGKVIFAKMV